VPRGRLANGGKLFISIHCNSMPKKPNPANGFETYILRPGRTEEAIRIAERENSVVTLEDDYKERYKQLTDENFILVTMAQNAHVKYSERFAQSVQEEIDRNVTLKNNGVSQAGFYVLVGASMPSVLIETAYLSNKSDERFLYGAAGQQSIAQGIFQAVRKFKMEYEKALREGK
jgi:N-acetylmuramoyl-L-alanine amidase